MQLLIYRIPLSCATKLGRITLTVMIQIRQIRWLNTKSSNLFVRSLLPCIPFTGLLNNKWCIGIILPFLLKIQVFKKKIAAVYIKFKALRNSIFVHPETYFSCRNKLIIEYNFESIPAQEI